MKQATDTHNLRSALRSMTKAAHDRLDASIGTLDLSDPAEYSDFLAIQYAARRPIEAWCAANMPADMCPPAQSDLIAADLATLGSRSPDHCPAFTPPANAGWLGIAWALGGSSMGNRAMLARMHKSSAHDWPTAFLADAAMTEYWAALKPRLEQPVSDALIDKAANGANAVFQCFEAAKTIYPTRIAA